MKVKKLNKNIKYITTEHSTSNNRRKSSIFKILDKFIYNYFDKVVAISEGTAESLIKWIGLDLKKLEIIENGVSLRAFMGKARERKGNNSCRRETDKSPGACAAAKSAHAFAKYIREEFIHTYIR